MPMTRRQMTLPIISNPTLASKVLDGVSIGYAPCSRVLPLVSILQRRNPAGYETFWDRFRSWACFGSKSVMQVRWVRSVCVQDSLECRVVEMPGQGAVIKEPMRLLLNLQRRRGRGRAMSRQAILRSCPTLCVCSQERMKP